MAKAKFQKKPGPSTLTKAISRRMDERYADKSKYEPIDFVGSKPSPQDALLLLTDRTAPRAPDVSRDYSYLDQVD